MPPKLLYQLDTDGTPSVFDSVVAFDGGADHVIGHPGVRPESVGPLVDGAIYTRGPAEKRFTALFVGGGDLALGEAVLAAVQARFFGRFRVSVMLDCNGCNTTAAAAVALIGQAVTLAGRRAVVLAGTGPVGSRVAAMLASGGAEVTITGREAARTEAAAAAIARRHGVRVGALTALDGAARAAAVEGAEIIVAGGAAGHELLGELAWRGAMVVADLNPQPPLGLAGISAGDRGRDYGTARVFGALCVGGVKLRLHRACVARLFEANDLVLDAVEILALAREMV